MMHPASTVRLDRRVAQTMPKICRNKTILKITPIERYVTLESRGIQRIVNLFREYSGR